MISTLFFLAQQAAPTGAAPGAQPQGNPILQFMPFIFMIVIAYFLMIRPQQKRQKEHQQLLANLKTGDTVVTSAGIHGLIANVKEKTVVVKVADNVKIEFDRNAITGVQRQQQTDSPKDASKTTN